MKTTGTIRKLISGFHRLLLSIWRAFGMDGTTSHMEELMKRVFSFMEPSLLNNRSRRDMAVPGVILELKYSEAVILLNRVGGTLYSSFINISDMDFVLVYRLDNQKITHLYLNEKFTQKKKQKIKQ